MNIDLLQSHRLLECIPRPMMEALIQKCQEQNLIPGEILLTPGQKNDTLYFLLSGRLLVHLNSRESGNSIAILPGEIIGEMSIIEHRPVSAWVVADHPSCLLAMPENVFWEEFILIPHATRRLLQLLIARVRKTDAVLLQELENKVRYEHLQRELVSAGKIQANILPAAKPLFPHHPQVDVHAIIRPAREVGGDFYDAFAVNDHILCVAVGDVSGKGMPAALFMVRVITLLRIILRRQENLETGLPSLNRLLCEANEECMFVTLAVALLNTHSGKLTYLNGGHNPPFISKQDQPFRVWDPPKGGLLGVEPTALYAAKEFVLGIGDTLVLYTDGVTEAENEHHELFTIERARDALNQAGSGASGMELTEALGKAVLQFAGESPQSDDITILALRYRGESTEYSHI